MTLKDYYRSSHESYDDQAKFCLKQNGFAKTCILKCKVNPEHRVHNKGYSITLTKKMKRILQILHFLQKGNHKSVSLVLLNTFIISLLYQL